MSAIAGVFGLPTDQLALSGMIQSMTRRGSGEEGIIKTNIGALLHRGMQGDRGKQPLQFTHHNELYSIVFDGEIYNSYELRCLLRSLGHALHENTDAELMLHAYTQWDVNALEMVNGVFSLAVWKHSSEELFVARDRMGVKPFFYKLHDGGLVFASEIKTILAYPTVKAELDAEGIAELLLIGPGRTPGSGLLRGILELEPGCCGCYRAGKWSVRQYWKLSDKIHEDPFETTVDKVRILVTDAIKRQMTAEQPLCAFLSGGLDSSIICAVCAEHKQNPLQTFSVDYHNNLQFFAPERFQPDTDNDYIKLMVDQLKTKQHWTILSTRALFDSLHEATIARDLPGMADVDSSLLLFCKDVAKKTNVVLSGECADEIFGGYPWFRDLAFNEVRGFPWAQNTKYRATFLAAWITDQIDPHAFVNDRYETSLKQCDIHPSVDPLERRMKQMINLNQRWFMQTLLDRSDRMSVCYGLKIRVPLCDYRIAEYMYTVPWEFKDYKHREKGLLRYAMKDLLPEKIINRKKSPFPKTYDPGYLDLVRGALMDVIRDPGEPIFQIVRREALEGLLSAEYSWPWYGQLMRVPQTIAYMLQINDWLKTYQIQIV